MHWVYSVIGVAVLLTVWIGLMKSGVSRVLRYAKSEGWEPLIVDGYPDAVDSENSELYRVRYRDKDGGLHECVLESVMLFHFKILRTLKIPDDMAKAMYDPEISMDCFRCGHTVSSGEEQCPYCKRWRHEFRIT